MKRADDAAWRKALGAGETPTPKPTKPKRPAGGGRVQLGTTIPAEMLEELHRLAARLYLKRGRRVTIADLVTEALADLLKKHSGR